VHGADSVISFVFSKINYK